MAQEKPLYVRGMQGLGDNLYQRAFISQLRGPVWLQTPWPELYEDLSGVHFVRARTTLRTQVKNVDRQAAARWEHPPAGAREIAVSYGRASPFDREPFISTAESMRRLFKVEPAWSLPPAPAACVGARPYALVRPVTVREEWRAEARNPRPEYIAEAVQELRRRGCFVISVADLEPGKEWLVAPDPGADQKLHHGELDVMQLLSLVSDAAVCVGGVGWLTPAALMARVPLYTVLGGLGGFNSRECLTDPTMDLSQTGWAIPENFCRCFSRQHGCRKEIPDFISKFRRWLDERGM